MYEYIAIIALNKINKKKPLGRPRIRRRDTTKKGYNIDKWRFNSRLDFEQRKMESLTSGSAGPQWTVKLLKKNKI